MRRPREAGGLNFCGAGDAASVAFQSAIIYVNVQVSLSF
jgi:hypothetical protein